jgi:hypothetical protein
MFNAVCINQVKPGTAMTPTTLLTLITMKNKLYVFLNKHRAIILVLMITSWLFTIFQLSNSSLSGVGLIFMIVLAGLAIFLMIEDTNRKHAKAIQFLMDQRNSSSPHWDGCVRSAKDIEPRLMLLRDRIEKDQHEVNRLEQTKND